MNLGPHPFSLRQLQYAVAVAESLNFRKAAERCCVSQPSLSAQLAELESSLGTPLFERNQKRVFPTPAGRLLLERARILLQGVDDFSNLAEHSRDPLVGTLRFGVVSTIAPYLVPLLRPQLRLAYPHMNIRWVEEKTASLRVQLESGDLDAAIVALEADLGEVEHEIVGFDPFVLVTASGHPLGTKNTPAKLEDIRSHCVLLLDDGHCFRDQALALCKRAKAHELEFRATSLGTLAQMVADGVGITLLPKLAIATESTRAELAVRPLVEPAPGRTIAIIWRPHSPLGGTLRQIGVTARKCPGLVEILRTKHTAATRRRRSK